MFARDKPSFDWINCKPQDFEGRDAEDGFIALFTESDWQGEGPSINCHLDGTDWAHQLAAVRQDESDLRFSGDTETLNNASGEPR